MRRDENGRWVSDNGRYAWTGTTWADLETPDGVEEAALAEAPKHRQHRRRRRSLGWLVGLALLVAIGVVAVLLVGERSTSGPTSAVTVPAGSGGSAGALSPSPSQPQMVDEQQRRERAQAALLQRGDLPGATEERSANPTDVFLPCQAPGLVPTAGSVLVGQAVSNNDFTIYAGQTVVGFPSVREATDALTRIRTTVAQCSPYDYRYANSPRVDRVTFSSIDPALTLGDGGAYLTEVDTPSNYAGSGTSYSYGYVQRGQFLVRLTLTNLSRADRPGLERLLGKSLAELG